MKGRQRSLATAETGKRHRSSIEVIATMTLQRPASMPSRRDDRPGSEVRVAFGSGPDLERALRPLATLTVHIAWAVNGTLDRNSEHEMERELSRYEVRILEATRRRGSK